MTERIVFRVPLPPPSLRANSRAHWATKKRDADAYSLDVLTSARVEIPDGEHGWPWDRALVLYVWRSCGVQSDHGNLGGNTKYLQDILCMAPRAKSGANRWYLGLVDDDAGITAEYRAERVATRAEECCEITIERTDDEHRHCYGEWHACWTLTPDEAARPREGSR